MGLLPLAGATKAAPASDVLAPALHPARAGKADHELQEEMMAEIRVEPKRGGGAKWLLVVLLLLALAALAYWWFVMNGGRVTDASPDVNDTARTSSALVHVIERVASAGGRAPALT